MVPKAQSDRQVQITLNRNACKIRYETALSKMFLIQHGRLPMPNTRAALRAWRDQWLQEFDDEWKRWA